MLKSVFFALGNDLCVWGVGDGLGWAVCKDKGGKCEQQKNYSHWLPPCLFIEITDCFYLLIVLRLDYLTLTP
jgi:hypothetical protein